LTWNPSPGATDYVISVSSSPTGPFASTHATITKILGIQKTPTTVTSTINSFIPNTKHYFEISATNSGGPSVKSTPPVSATTTPAPPTNIAATAQSSTSIKIQWTASTGATSYKIYRDTSPSGTFTTLAGMSTTTSFTNTALTPNTTYYYKVSSVSASGTSEQPLSAVSITTPMAPPHSPTGISATALSPTSIKIQWTASPGATSYTVYRSTSATGPFTTQIGTSTTTSYTDTGLVSGMKYYYEIKSINSGGTSALSTPSASSIA
jgi:fibronectin type 3 domain-containing protein